MFNRNKKRKTELYPDEIFLDDSNLPDFNKHQLEGQLERPIKKSAIWSLAVIFLVVGGVFIARAAILQVAQGANFASISQNNTLRQTPVLAERGIIYDRNGVELAWNDSGRQYIETPGLGQVLGYIGYPSEDALAQKDYAEKEMIGIHGAEESFDKQLSGKTGLQIEEVDAKGDVASKHILEEPQSGESIHLAIDSRLQTKMYSLIESLAKDHGYKGGAGIILDLQTGETPVLVSYPEYDPNVLVSKRDNQKISAYLKDPGTPFLNRAINGLYTPGSVFKPLMAVGALTEHIISPNKVLYTTGSISIPNPYDPKQKTVFKDWKNHGAVDMRHAISVSSDVYFYTIGGGFGGQAGMGIANIDKYAKLFGLGSMTGINLGSEAIGQISTPEWKAKNYPNDKQWRIGNTYHTVIGQYGTQVTPIQMLRAIGGVATGYLIQPTILKTATSTPSANKIDLHLDPSVLEVVHEGMHLASTEGTAKGLNMPDVPMGAKTGTAELGASKAHINSWVTGFFPYDKPHYAFIVVMQEGPVANTLGGVYIMRQFFDWVRIYAPEYLK